VVESPNAKSDVPAGLAGGQFLTSGSDAFAVEIFGQEPHRSQFKVASENQPNGLGLLPVFY
jgi:hypothetical protein